MTAPPTTPTRQEGRERDQSETVVSQPTVGQDPPEPVAEKSPQPIAPPGRAPWLRRFFGYLFGYDFFISYTWKDGRDYAVT
jgi:hypothetical protein